MTGIPDELLVERDTRDSYPAEDIEILSEQAAIDVRNIVGYEIGVFDGFSKVAVIEYYLLNPRVGYIGWLTVDDKWQRQGIATELRQRAIAHMEERGIEEMWSGPVAPELESTVKRQGFAPADIDFSGYYVRQS